METLSYWHWVTGKMIARGIELLFGVAIIIGSAASVFPTQELNKQIPNILLASIILLFVFTRWYKTILDRPF